MSEAMDRRDEILRRLLLEEADPLAAFAHSELAADAGARAELEQLLEAQRRVQALAGNEREALRPSGPGSAARQAEERVLARLREHVATQKPVPSAPRRRVNVALLLAAALALFLGGRWLAAPEPEPDTPLGSGGHIEVLPVATFGEIAWTWTGKRPAGSRFVVHVFDGAASGLDGEVASSPPLEQNRWTPAEDEWTRWPDEIRIHVELWGPGPNELLERSLEVRARRSP
jgi:hypothetical protein